MNERWVCKRCFADNEGERSSCERCGLVRGSEATLADRQAWASAAGLPPPETEKPAWQRWLRFWWIPVVAVVLVVGYVTTARRGDDGALTDAGTLTIEDLRVGDCFNSVEEGEINDVDAVPCDEPHAYEVYAIADSTASAYPASDAQFEAAFFEICVPPFEDYVGIAYAESELWASAIIPTEDGWNAGDREFTCHLHDERESMLTGSQRGSGR